MVAFMWLGIGIIALIIIYLVYIYNKMAVLQNRIENAWSQIDVQLKKRYDLIPNLVNTVKGYAKHEKGLLESVTKMRASALKAADMKERAKHENMISAALKSIFAVAENYPQLRASENFKLLQEQLEGVESKIAYSRQFYNDSVLSYDNTISKFPGNFFAKAYGYLPKPYFETENEIERKPVKVEF